MQSVNSITLLGNIGNPPEIRKVTDTFTVAKFSVATNETKKNKDGTYITSATWHDVEVHNPHFIKVIEDKVKKGSAVYLTGKLVKESYTSKKTGLASTRWFVLIGKYEGTFILLDKSETEHEKPATKDKTPYNVYKQTLEPKHNSWIDEVGDFVEDDVPLF